MWVHVASGCYYYLNRMRLLYLLNCGFPNFICIKQNDWLLTLAALVPVVPVVIVIETLANLSSKPSCYSLVAICYCDVSFIILYQD